MQHLLNRMRLEGGEAATSGRSPTRLGLITNYDPLTHAVRVALQPDETDSGWIPMATQAIGQGWGLVCAPNIGDQAVVTFHQDHSECGIVIGVIHHDGARAPTDASGAGAPSGEYWLIHQSGSSIKLTNDGKISGHSAVEVDMGNLTQAVVRLVREEFMALYNAHTHVGGGGQPVPASQMVAATHLTTVLKAN